MKIKFIRSDNGVAAAFNTEEYADQIVQIDGQPFWKLGAVVEVDRRGAQLLVGNGDCDPADDEATEACANYMLKREEVLLSREMLARAIDPDDRERYRNGEILGYDADGNDIPGPNWVEPAEPDFEEDE